MSTLVHSGDEVEVRHLKGSSPFLLVTFSHLTTKGDGFWGEPPCSKAGISALGFVAKSRNWFPRAEVSRAIASVRAILDDSPLVMTYGFSFGAYAALRYAEDLGASRALAFSPQFSIDPADVGAFDRRFLAYFRPDQHEAMRITAPGRRPDAWMFVDPFFRADRLHAEKILAAWPEIELVPIPHFGHSTILAVSRTATLTALLDAAAKGCRAAVRSAAVNARRVAAVRPAMTAIGSASKRPWLSAKIMEAYPDAFDGRRSQTLLRQMARAWLNKGRPDLGREWAQRAVDARPSDERAAALLSLAIERAAADRGGQKTSSREKSRMVGTAS